MANPDHNLRAEMEARVNQTIHSVLGDNSTLQPHLDAMSQNVLQSIERNKSGMETSGRIAPSRLREDIDGQIQASSLPEELRAQILEAYHQVIEVRCPSVSFARHV